LNLRNCRLGIIGLGYVGLPLAAEFGKHFETVGFDLNARRIAELKAGRDHTLEVSKEELAGASRLTFTTDPAELRRCQVFIVTVPTPIDEYKRPDLTPLERASETVGKALKKGAVVV
jgi:UDP-N-acetyl-D-galactosamine dehydrogenase